MFQIKTQMVQALVVGLALFMGSVGLADQSCKISRDEREQLALALAWKQLDSSMRKTKFSIEWLLYSDIKMRSGKSLENRANDPKAACRPKLEVDILHQRHNIGIKNGIIAYREFFLKPNRKNPEIYARVLNGVTCPSSEDLKIRDEYQRAQRRAIDNLTYVVYHRLATIKGESTRVAEDLPVLAELRSQLDTIRPEVIRVGGDLEFHKRADKFGESLGVALKTNPSVLCYRAYDGLTKYTDAIYDAVKPKFLEVQTTPVK